MSGTLVDGRSFLGKMVTVHIDRPLGARHPDWDILYPVNYGYLPDVPAPDGEELDAYVLAVDEPIDVFTGVCIALIHRLHDQDDKLVVVPPGVTFSDGQIREATAFQEQFFHSVIIR